jgi:hypothetical protein
VGLPFPQKMRNKANSLLAILKSLSHTAGPPVCAEWVYDTDMVNLIRLHATAIALAGLRLCAAGPVYLGVLEPPPPELHKFYVRVAFQFRDGQWEPMPDVDVRTEAPAGYPARVSWTVAFDGRSLGEVKTVIRGKAARYEELGMQDLTPDSKAPEVRAGAAVFDHGAGAAQFRPLVVVSQPNYTDPDSWKPFAVTEKEWGKSVRGEYRKRHVGDPACGDRKDCPDEFLLLAPKGYRSARGDVLAAVKTDVKKVPCDCPNEDWSADWYLVRKGGFTFVGEGLTLIDAGDYDGDGSSEIVFQKVGEGDSDDAYVLLAPKTGKAITFHWPSYY